MQGERHWPEYAIEAALLGIFMVSACACTVALEHPASLAHGAIGDAFTRRALIGLAMGVTAVALIYSPWGKRSGAHFNPAVTIAFHRLGKIETRDAVAYVLAQCAGGVAGVALSALVLGMLVAHPSVDYAVTVPGPAGRGAAFAAEAAISFVQMGAVLVLANGRHARVTGLVAGVLVAIWITFEAPFSGMSMNPARSFGSAVLANLWSGFWIYLTAPVLGMLAAAEAYARVRGRHRVYCAKLAHDDGTLRCIFRCNQGALAGASAGAARAARGARRTAATLALALGLALLAGAAPATAHEHAPAANGGRSAPAAVASVGAIGMTVGDLDRSVDFYSRILGFTKTSEVERAGEAWEELEGVFGLRTRSATLRLGDESIVLTEYLTPRGRPIAVETPANDRTFQHVAIIVRDMQRAYAWLRANDVAYASTGPQRLPDWNPNAGGIEAFYFHDPDGHFLEILAFPPGKGAARWHRPGDDLFLGIDHTAIVVGDTARSLRFYRDTLGFAVAGRSENYGTEQAHLNNVRGAHLRITTLRAPAGPGIELLEYLAPRDGRPAPRDLRANDLVHWQTALHADDVARAARVLGARHAGFVSPGLVPLPDAGDGGDAAFLVRDPDGHALELVGEKTPAPGVEENDR